MTTRPAAWADGPHRPPGLSLVAILCAAAVLMAACIAAKSTHSPGGSDASSRKSGPVRPRQEVQPCFVRPDREYVPSCARG
jgi:hypothetical protein